MGESSAQLFVSSPSIIITLQAFFISALFSLFWNPFFFLLMFLFYFFPSLFIVLLAYRLYILIFSNINNILHVLRFGLCASWINQMFFFCVLVTLLVGSSTVLLSFSYMHHLILLMKRKSDV